MFVREEIIQTTISVILNTREFCGNEKDAAMEHLAENGVAKADRVRAFRAANFRANKVWNGWQREAGVPEKHLF